MKRVGLLLACVAALSGAAAPRDGRRLVWSDEFDGSSLDATKWKFHPTMNSHAEHPSPSC